MNFNLDFNLITSEERCNFINSQDLSMLTPKEIELCSNYILYGKDKDKNYTSMVDRKEIQIKTKFKSYSRTEPLSLDALLESPTFDESLLQKKTHYKKVKPTIDREQLKDVPGIKELWTQIDRLQEILDINTGKKEQPENFKPLSNKELYYLKHNLIEMRRDQYIIKDSVSPTLPPPQNKSSYFNFIQDSQLNYPVYPRGIMRTEFDKDFISPRNSKGKITVKDIEKEIFIRERNGKPYFNFLNREHIYQLILNYWEIKAAIENIPDSPLHGLLWTLDFYIEKADLSEQQKLIIRDKKFKLPNKEIAKNLELELGITHQENYVSTIWNKIVGLIVAAAELNYDEWINSRYDKSWKICNCCHRELLRVPRNFVKKSKSSDGLTGRCKKCDKEIRLQKKRGENK